MKSTIKILLLKLRLPIQLLLTGIVCIGNVAYSQTVSFSYSSPVCVNLATINPTKSAGFQANLKSSERKQHLKLFKE
jgi:hypothetical protein